MHQFIFIWFGQLISTVGSYMTNFALTLWAWEFTNSATSLALMGFFSQLFRIPVSLFGGIIVDRFSRKKLMILGDSVSAFSTVIIGFLFLTNNLQIWHLYLIASFNGIFGQLQSLAYQTSITLIVPKEQYTRANSLNSSVHYGSAIFAPALAGILYPTIGVLGIIMIDFSTFAIALITLVIVFIPQPNQRNENNSETIKDKLTFGFRYVWINPVLCRLLIVTSLFWFFHDLGGAIYDPMILAKSNSSSQALANVASAAGLGGVTGAILLTIWGGQKIIFGVCLWVLWALGLLKLFSGWGVIYRYGFPLSFFLPSIFLYSVAVKRLFGWKVLNQRFKGEFLPVII